MFEFTGMKDNSMLRSAIKSYDCTSIDDIAKLPRYGIEGTQTLDDGRDDINNAPCGYGSTAMVATGTSTKIYKLMRDNQWTKI